MRNIEVKARLHDPAALELRLRQLPARFVASFWQRDVFFRSPQGRLKLRFSEGDAELIYYVRSDDATLRGSDYQRQTVTDGDGLCSILEAALGSCGEVRKQRRLYLLDNIRIHIDDVEGLGSYMEVEAVIDAEHDETACQRATQELLKVLEITSAHFEARAYVNLLLER